MPRPTQVALPSRSACLYRTLTVCGPSFQTVPVRKTRSFERSYNPTDASTTVVWALSLSIATTREIDLFFLFLRVLRCFSSPGWLHLTMVHGLHPCGLTHSDIPGSKPVCGSPGLFAAYHVLRRLQKPRHPPFALVTFNFCEIEAYRFALTPVASRHPLSGGIRSAEPIRAATLLRCLRHLADARRDA